MTNAIANMAASIATAEKKTAAKPATKKTAAKPAIKAAAKPATKKTAKPAQKVETSKAAAIRETFIESLKARMVAAPESKTLVTDYNFFNDDKQYSEAVIDAAMNAGFDVETIASRTGISEKKQAGFIGMKVITKIRQVFTAMHTKSLQSCDGYTIAILRNMVESNKALDTHDMMRCVSTKVARNDVLRESAPVKAYKGTSANTADTQTSSTRMMLGEIGVLMVNKGKKGDKPEWADTKQAGIIRAMIEKQFNIEQRA